MRSPNMNKKLVWEAAFFLSGIIDYLTSTNHPDKSP